MTRIYLEAPGYHVYGWLLELWDLPHRKKFSDLIRKFMLRSNVECIVGDKTFSKAILGRVVYCVKPFTILEQKRRKGGKQSKIYEAKINKILGEIFKFFIWEHEILLLAQGRDIPTVAVNRPVSPEYFIDSLGRSCSPSSRAAAVRSASNTALYDPFTFVSLSPPNPHLKAKRKLLSTQCHREILHYKERKPFNQLKSQQQRNRINRIVRRAKETLSRIFHPNVLKIQYVNAIIHGRAVHIDMRSNAELVNATAVRQQAVKTVLAAKTKAVISDRGYGVLRRAMKQGTSNPNQLPPLPQLQLLSRSLATSFSMISTSTGAKQSLILLLQHEVRASATLMNMDCLVIKLTLDGTVAGRMGTFTNVMAIIINRSDQQSVYGCLPLMILNINEKYEKLQPEFEDLRREVEELTNCGLRVDCRTIKIVFRWAADYKATLLVYGLMQANSRHPCIFCEIPSTALANCTKLFSRRSVESITQCAKGGANNKSCCRPPLIPEIPVSSVVIDIMHAGIRIPTRLFENLILDVESIQLTARIGESRERPNNVVERNDALSALECCMREVLNRPTWQIMEKTRECNDRKWTALTAQDWSRFLVAASDGEIIKRLLVGMSAKNISDRQKLWSDLCCFFHQLRHDVLNSLRIDAWEVMAHTWLTLFNQVYPKRVIPYMHLIFFHGAEMLRRENGSIAAFQQQGVEKFNDRAKMQLFRATNHRRPTQLAKVMELTNIQLRTKEFLIMPEEQHHCCSRCNGRGHNKSTCVVSPVNL